MANELTWYSAMNLALLDTSTHELRCKSVLLAIKRLLTQESTGTLYGPNGAPPAGAAATVISSSDGVTAGAGDRWTDLTKLVRGGSGGAAHSWIVLKLGDYYLIIDWAYSGTTNAFHHCTFGISKAAPTGGSTTARPTATDESVTAASHIFTLSSVTVWIAGRAHLTIAQDPNGQWIFWIAHSQNGSSEFSGVFGLQTKKGSHASDTFKGMIVCEGTANAGAANNTVLRDTGGSFGNTSGTTGVFRGRNLNNTAAVIYSFFGKAHSGGTYWQAAWSSDQQTGEFHEVIPELFCATSGNYGRAGGGFLYDVTEIHRAAHGSTKPPSGDVEKLSIGVLALPFTAVPTL